MDQQAVLAAFSEQVRKHPDPGAPDAHVEYGDRVVRSVSAGDGWTGVTWCDLDEAETTAIPSERHGP